MKRVTAVWLLALIVGGCDKKDAPPPAASASAATTSAAPAPSASASAQPASDEIAFTAEDAKVGAMRTVEDQTVSTDTLSIGKRTDDWRRVVKEEIVAAEGRIVTKLKLTMVEWTSKSTIGGKTENFPKELGKAYIVELKDKKLVLSDGNAKPVSANEWFYDTLLSEHALSVGKVEPLLAGAPPGPLKVGAVAFEDALRAYLHGWYSASPPKAELTNVSVKLKAIKIEGGVKLGVFDVTSKVTTKTPPNVYDLAGTMTVRADGCRLVELDLKGPAVYNGIKQAGDETSHLVRIKY